MLGKEPKPTDWFAALVRIAGASFPGASSLVQLQAEIDSSSLLNRVQKLEDPISTLHGCVPETARCIYQCLEEQNERLVDLEESLYDAFRRPIAALEAAGYIRVHHVLGPRKPVGITLTDPSFILYMCALAEDGSRMNQLTHIVDNCDIGQWLDGDQLALDFDLPVPVVGACFEIYEAKGYGLRSRTLQRCRYMGKA